MRSWQEQLTAIDRVRQRTPQHVLDRLDESVRERVRSLKDAPSEEISRRIAELDGEWDVERLLITNAATLATAGIVAGLTWKRQALLFPLAIGFFLLQHGVQGWCPPLALLRQGSARTRREIDLERYALKAIRGDFGPTAGAVTSTSVLEHTIRR